MSLNQRKLNLKIIHLEFLSIVFFSFILLSFQRFFVFSLSCPFSMHFSLSLFSTKKKDRHYHQAVWGVTSFLSPLSLSLSISPYCQSLVSVQSRCTCVPMLVMLLDGCRSSVTTKCVSVLLVYQPSQCPCCVWKIHGWGTTQSIQNFFGRWGWFSGTNCLGVGKLKKKKLSVIN